MPGSESVKTCNKCHQEKPLSDFYRSNKSPDGHQYTCKPCAVAGARQWAKEHPDRHRENMRRYSQRENAKAVRRASYAAKKAERAATRQDWYGRNREAVTAKWRERYATDAEYRERRRAASREWRKANRQRRLAWQIKALYGLSWDEFQAMIVAQLGRCAICREPADLVIDHDHESDPLSPTIRGLLCDPL